jgi:type IV pilus assembly protein PilC
MSIIPSNIDTNRIVAVIKGVSLKEKIIFTRNLGLIVKAGISLHQGLETLSEQTDSRLLKLILSQVKEDVNKGQAFSDSLAKHPRVFNSFYTNMVKTGEASGSLEKILKTLARQMEKERSLRSKVIGALIYPAIILVLMILVLVGMMIFAVPQLTAVFQDFGAELPFLTRAVIATSDALIENLTIFFFLLILVPLALWYFFFRYSKGKIALSWLLLHVPVFSNLTKKINSARISRTLQTLISSGVPILTALSITSDVLQNHFYKATLVQAQQQIEKGKQLSEILKTYPRLYPPIATQLISVGEATGSLDTILEDIAQFYEDEVDVITKSLSSIIEPVIMIVIGIFVGTFAVSMLQPIYSLTGSISY